MATEPQPHLAQDVRVLWLKELCRHLTFGCVECRRNAVQFFGLNVDDLTTNEWRRIVVDVPPPPLRGES